MLPGKGGQSTALVNIILQFRIINRFKLHIPISLQHLIDQRRPFLVAFTKADKIRRSERSKLLAAFKSNFEENVEIVSYPSGLRSGSSGSDAESPRIQTLFFSARTGEGKNDIWRWIEEMTA